MTFQRQPLFPGTRASERERVRVIEQMRVRKVERERERENEREGEQTTHVIPNTIDLCGLPVGTCA